jgi:energy-converting hydrogenase Eha subunit F
MKFAELIIWGFIIYLAYKFIFGLLLPVGKAASQMKDNIKKMQETQHQNSHTPEDDSHVKPDTPTSKGGEYIDYEEIK